jgi:hypothetical protein
MSEDGKKKNLFEKKYQEFLLKNPTLYKFIF